MAELTEPQEKREDALLHYWHLKCFRELGFLRHQAEILELAKVDWHEAEALLSQGCPHALVIHILT